MSEPSGSDSLYDLYQELGLPVELIDPTAGIAVLNLKDIGFRLPYQSPPFRPNYFSFLFVRNGRGSYTIDDQTFASEPGSIYFTNPSNYRTFEWTEIEDVYLMTFDEVFLKENLHPAIFDEFPFLLTETIQPKTFDAAFFNDMEQIYLLIHREYRGRSKYKYRIISSLFVSLLLKIKEHFWEDYNPIHEGNRSSQIVRDFKLQLEKHYRDLSSGVAEKVFRVQDYADLQHLHPNYLSNVIKSKTGKPIAAWIAGKTIAQAKSLLGNSQLPVKEVAYRLGFSEAAHFSHFFKKHTGIAPMGYRRL
jgi:AraC family transcriptional regulator, transcriptional activator of pobA